MSRQVFHPYQEWEDFRAGMFRQMNPLPVEIENSRRVLACADTFKEAAREMVRAWPKAAAHNLTDLGQNRRAWIGQATCCYSVQSSQVATCQAWWQLSADQRNQANDVADQVIAEWEELAPWAQTALFAQGNDIA